MTITTEFKQKSQNPKQFQSLVFVGGREKQDFPRQNLKLPSPDHCFLCDIQIDDIVAIAQVKTAKNIQKHLSQLGLRPNTEIKIASKTLTDSVIIAIDDRHIGLGSTITQEIIVRLISEK